VQGETIETEEEAPEVEVVEDDEEVVDGAEEEESALSGLVGRLELVVGDNAEAAELLASLKGEIGDADAKMVGMEDQVAAMKDQYLRLNADFDNFRKRTLKEKENLASSAKGDFVKALLPVLDNFDLAEKNIKGSTEGEEKILTGYQNMHKQLMEILSSQGLEVVAGVGEPFDPNDHEAIMREENDEMDEDTIIEEFRKGYKIGSSLIRASMVKVSTKS
jgi:molecular chaperone GrpE